MRTADIKIDQDMGNSCKKKNNTSHSVWQPNTSYEMIKCAKKTSDPSQQISTHSNSKVVKYRKDMGLKLQILK